jgi:uncharacterized protein (TIGR00251 family)
MAADGWLRRTTDGIEVRVRLSPKASSDGIGGLHTDADGNVRLAVRVRAVPEGGKANAALIGVIAKAAGMPKSRVEIIAGNAARLKTLRLRAGSADDAAQAVDRLSSAAT